MGVRSRLKSRFRHVIGDSRDSSDRGSPGPGSSPNPRPPTKSGEPETPREPAASSEPVAAEEAPAPEEPESTEEAPAPEEPESTEEAPAPEEAPVPEEPESTEEAPAPSEQEDPSPPADDSDAGVPAIVNDAPVRNAHHREAFESTEQARLVKIHNTETETDIEFSCEPDEFVLDAAERAGHELPYSCRSGGCLSCTGLIVSGTTRMTEEQYVLEDDHIERGFTLLCITIVDTDAEFLSHQEDAVE